MAHTVRLNTALVSLTTLVAVFAQSCPRAEAQVKPFQVRGAGIVDYVPLVEHVPVFHFAVGQATGMGRYYGEGQVQLNQFTGPVTADFSSAVPFVFTAANGDKFELFSLQGPSTAEGCWQ